jgi:hypothetical protein
MNCRQCEQMIVDALYGELDTEARSRFEEHVGSCPECQRTYAHLKSTLEVMDRYERSDPGQAYWDGYWNRLTTRMEREQEEKRQASWLRRLLPGLSATGARWAYWSTLAVTLVVFGAVVGRMILPGPGIEPTITAERPDEESLAVKPDKGAEEPGTAPIAPVVKMASAEACARQYIEDSQVLLLALINFDSETEAEYLADWSPEKRRSRELIAQAGSIKNDLSDPKQRRLRELVTELEMILIQIANLETTGDLEAVDLIRSSVSKRDMMFKIDLEKVRGSDTDKPEPGACDA